MASAAGPYRQIYCVIRLVQLENDVKQFVVVYFLVPAKKNTRTTPTL